LRLIEANNLAVDESGGDDRGVLHRYQPNGQTQWEDRGLATPKLDTKHGSSVCRERDWELIGSFQHPS
jgi:hypothetical protein